MKRVWRALAGAALLAGSAACAQEPEVEAMAARDRMFSRAEMAADIDVMLGVFKAAHPGLARHRPLAEVEAAFDAAVAALPETADELAFLRIVGRLTAAVKDGHTSARLSPAAQAYLLEQERVLPLDPLVFENRLFVKRAYGPAAASLPVGAEILEINERSAADVIAAVAAVKGVDGYAEPPRYRGLEINFWYHYYRFVDDAADVDLIVRDPGAEEARALRLAGLPYAQIREERGADRPDALRLDIDDDAGVAVMTIEHFIGDDTEDFFAESFATLRDRGVADLIIDIRGNGGGYDKYNTALFAYLSPRPFVYYRGWDHVSPSYADLAHAEVDPDEFFWELAEPPSEEERAAIMAGKDLSDMLDFAISTFVTAGVHQPNDDLRFRGDVYMLFDGASGSSGGEVPALAHHLGLATLIGEEPNSAYEGATAGIFAHLTLPNSQIRVNVPLIAYHNAVMPGVFEHRAVQPEFHVVQTPDDLIAGRDTVMDFTRELIRSRRGAAPTP